MGKVPLNSTAYAIITIGGTEEPLDGVRGLCNHAEGDLGVEVGKMFLRYGIRVIFVAGRKAQLKHALWLATTRGVSMLPFSSIASHNEEIERTIRENGQPAYAFATAALTDFLGTGSTGKVPSDKPYQLTLMPAPKAIDTWRELFGRKCFIVGFKYLAEGASVGNVLQKAREQNVRAHLNATFANLKGEIGDGLHPGWIMKPDGGALRLDGERSDVARQLVAFAIRMTRTTWARSEHAGPAVGQTPPLMSDMVSFAQETGLLTDRSGNVVVSVGDELWVTPRGVDKSAVSSDACIPTRCDFDARVVSYRGDQERKPSIDSYVYHLLRRHLPEFGGALHFHDALVVEAVRTREGYPCGTAQESWMVIEAIAKNAIPGCPVLGSHGAMVELAEHGHMLVFPADAARCLVNLKADWARARSAYVDHLRDVDQEHRLSEMRLSPVFLRSRIIGVAARHLAEGWTSVFLEEGVRKAGIGYQVVQLLNHQGRTVGAHDNCRVRDYYMSHGFRVIREENGLSVLEPPSLRADLVDSATIRVTCLAEEVVLLGKRAETKPDGSPMSYPGLWANLGGQIDDADIVESSPVMEPGARRGSWAAAVREFGEEQVGIDLSAYPEPKPFGVYYTGTKKRAYRVTAYAIDLPRAMPTRTRSPGETSEVSWNPLGSVLSLPMGQATRATMRLLFSEDS